MSYLRSGLGIALLVGAGVACGSMGDATSAFGAGDPSARGDAGGANTGAGPTATPGLPALDNGIILVHAAKTDSFRVCFENAPELQPMPDSKIMPDSNIVGLDVGTAVRLDPLKGAPGMITLYPLVALDGLYGPGKTKPPTCGDLALIQNVAKFRVELDRLNDDLSQGVHVIAITGCVGGQGSVATCGANYDAQNGNLGFFHEVLRGFTRPGENVLPMQVVHLSQAVEAARGARALSVVFKDGNATPSKETAIADTKSGLSVFDAAMPADQPLNLPFDSADAGSYAGYSVKIQLAGDAGADAGTVLREQTLAEIQELSSPRDLPTTYYAKASNFVLLMIGDPALVQADGGGDPYAQLHLLAVPVREPKADAGADGGDGG